MGDLARKPHVVYVLQDCQEGTLYVGMTSDLPRRLREHRTRSRFWGLVTNVWTQNVTNRATACEVELDLIAACAPAFNVQGQVS